MVKSPDFILRRLHIASQLPFFGFLFCGDTARDWIITVSFSIAYVGNIQQGQYFCVPRVVSVVKAKSMNRSQCLDVYLKLVLGETL